MIKDTIAILCLAAFGLSAAIAWLEPEPSTVTMRTEQE